MFLIPRRLAPFFYPTLWAIATAITAAIMYTAIKGAKEETGKERLIKITTEAIELGPAGLAAAILGAIAGTVFIWVSWEVIMGGLAVAVYDFFDTRWGKQAAQRKLEEQNRTIQELRAENEELRRQREDQDPGEGGNDAASPK